VIRPGAASVAHRALLVITLALAHGDLGTAADAPAVAVEYRDERLTAHLEHVAVGVVLEQIGRATGAEIRGQIRTPHEVSVDFEAVPLSEALHRLLGGQNFALTYGQGGRLRAIELLGVPEPPLAVPAMPASTLPVAALPARLGFPRRFPSRRSLRMPESLSALMGSETATFDQVFDVAKGEGDGLVRAQASMVALSALERDRRLRRTLITALRNMDDATLAAFLRTPEGQRLEDLIEFFAVHSREASLQKKASVVLERLRAQAAEPPAS
jgi:hypothetical protein